MVPSRDLKDPLGTALLAVCTENQDALTQYISTETARLGSDEAATSTVRQQLYAARWGPTRIPIYNVLLTFLVIKPTDKPHFLALTQYLTDELKVPVDGTDVTGATALYWSISTKPFAEPAFAELLFRAGGSVNAKTRFGSNAAAEIAQVDLHGDTAPNVAMLRWFVQHGGDVDAKDSEGMNVRTLVEMMRKKVPGLAGVVEKGRGARGPNVCTNCGREEGVSAGVGLKACGKCQGVRYCGVECQRVDWRVHKKKCNVK